MRELTAIEMQFVSGAHGVCTPRSSGNSYGGVTQPSSLGQDLIAIYEGLVSVTSHMIERVANAL